MIAVDIGNTFTRIAAFAGEAIIGRQYFPTRDLDVTELMPAFDELSRLADAPDVWVASVSPGSNAVVDSAAERIGLRRHFIRGGDNILPHTLSTPATTGVDRLLSAMSAGRRHFPTQRHPDGYIVIQCGSAATVDYVDGTGTFRGGYILPGPGMWLGGLSRAAQLPDLSEEMPEWGKMAVGDNTHDAMTHGMHVALPVAVASAALLMNSPEGGPVGTPPVVLTGGWGEAVEPFIRSNHVFDKDLLLHGIRFHSESAH